MNRSTAENLLLFVVSEEMDLRPPKTTPEVTVVLTRAVCLWLPRIGATKVRCEVSLKNAQGLVDGVRPRYDVVGTWPSGRRLVVEIDRSHKPYSLVKLRDARERGDSVLWLRWRGGRNATAPINDVPVMWVYLGEWSKN